MCDFYGRNLNQFWWNFLHHSLEPKGKIEFIMGQNSTIPSTIFAPIFHPRNAFSTAMSEHYTTRNEAGGQIVAFDSSNGASLRPLIILHNWKIYNPHVFFSRGPLM